MITAEAKNKAIGMLSVGIGINEVAGELDLPLALVDEWSHNIPDKAIAKAEAMCSAVGMIIKSGASEDLKPQIKEALQKTSLEIIEKISFAVYTNDLLAAQITKNAADSISRLYSTIIGDEKDLNMPDVEISNSQVKAFASLTKD